MRSAHVGGFAANPGTPVLTRTSTKYTPGLREGEVTTIVVSDQSDGETNSFSPNCTPAAVDPNPMPVIVTCSPKCS